MRTTDEQLRIILQRSDRIAEKRKLRSKMLTDVFSLCACACLIIITATFLPGMSPSSAGNSGDHYGSLILSTSHMGYVVIGVIAFIAGIFVTLLTQHYRRLQSIEREKESTEHEKEQDRQ